MTVLRVSVVVMCISGLLNGQGSSDDITEPGIFSIISPYRVYNFLFNVHSCLK